MKKIKRVVIFFLVGIVLAFLALLSIGILLEIGVLKQAPDEPEVTRKYQPISIGRETDEDSIPDSKYYSTVQEALSNSNLTTDAEQLYQKNIDEIIAQFENENYISVYFKSIKNKDVECITFAKFKKKLIDEEEKYAFLRAIPTETKRGALVLDTLETLIEDQLMSSDYKQSINIDPEHTRFVYGDCKSKEIYKLKVENQEPSGIVPYEVFGETRYFWYFENLESDVAGSQLKFTLE